jgi:rfaE bifunctional protein nucleotidyltransferase chain/domain
VKNNPEKQLAIEKIFLPSERIVTFNEACETIVLLKEKGLKVVLAQGVFDILHVGHLQYLELARQAGDVLVVGVENDESVKLNKGENRPINPLKHRLEVLTALRMVSLVFPFTDALKYARGSDEDYQERYKVLDPSVVAVSCWDPNFEQKQRQSKEAGIELVAIDDEWINSTTEILAKIFLCTNQQ